MSRRRRIRLRQFLQALDTPPPRSQCAGGPRPCQWTRCKFRLEPQAAVGWDIPAPHCVLDVADAVTAGAAPPEQWQIATWMGIARQRVQQIEPRGLRKLIENARALGLPVVDGLDAAHEHLDDVIYRYLVNFPGGLTIPQIAENCGAKPISVQVSMRRLAAEGRARCLDGRMPRRWVALRGEAGELLESTRFRRSRRRIAA